MVSKNLRPPTDFTSYDNKTIPGRGECTFGRDDNAAIAWVNFLTKIKSYSRIASGSMFWALALHFFNEQILPTFRTVLCS